MPRQDPPSASAPDRGGASWAPAVAAFVVFAWMMAVSTWGSVEPGLSMVVVGLYLAFASATVFGIGSATRLHWVLGFAVAIAASPVFVWQFREVVRLPDLKSQVPLVCLGAAVVLFGVASLSARWPFRRLVVWTLLSATVFVTLLGVGFSRSRELRWSLLKKHTAFGFPAQLVLGPAARDVRTRLWDVRTGDDAATVESTLRAVTDRSSPTVVFVMLDALRRDGLSVYGGREELMPKVSGMALQSVVFEDVLVNATWTRPSIASMFTGLYQEYHGAVGRKDALRSDVETLAERLARRGFETAAFVTNWGAVGKDAGFDRGFELFIEMRSDSDPYLRADGVTREVLQWVRDKDFGEGDGRRPLFLYVHYLDPHIPYLSGGSDSTVFSIARRAYDNELVFLDGHVAELMRSLEAEIPGPVVTIVAADHGEEFGDHGQKGHGYTLYQEVARVPVFVRVPAGISGSVDARLEGRDIFDLILAASGDNGFDPVEWAQTRDRDQRYTSEYLSSDVPHYRLQYRDIGMRGVDRDGLFVIWSALGSTVEVYDRTSDPRELQNLAAELDLRLDEVTDELDRLVPVPWAQREPVLLSSDTEEQLRALGYID